MAIDRKELRWSLMCKLMGDPTAKQLADHARAYEWPGDMAEQLVGLSDDEVVVWIHSTLDATDEEFEEASKEAK